MAFADGGACGRRLLSRTGTGGSSREGHVMIRILGFRGLAVGLFAACAAMVAAPAAQADPTGAMSPLTAVTGQGTGMVIVSPTSAGMGSFVAQVKVNIHDAAPNTTFAITRAVAAPDSGCANSTPFHPSRHADHIGGRRGRGGVRARRPRHWAQSVLRPHPPGERQ